ncbi:MAG: hypothetical protein KF696_08485 [Planctomycetes bacterium]|nr:hypothetical protein [Planctomycetota bacterium]MCW8135613.1 hypothetical protein [Planctomycetota bacterium]
MPKKASKALIMVRLFVALGAVVVAGVVTIVALNSGGSNVPQTAEGNTEQPGSLARALPANRHAGQKDARQSADRQSAIRAFLAMVPSWKRDLEKAAADLAAAENDLRAELSARESTARADAERAREALTTLDSSAEGLREKLARNRDAEKKARDEYEQRLSEQSPASKFFQALEATRTARAEVAKAEAAWSAARKQLETALEAVDAAYEAYYALDDEAQEEAARNVIIAAEEAAAEKRRAETDRRSELDAARRAEVASRAEIGRVHREIAALDNPNARKVSEAYSVYEKSLKALDEQWSRLASLDVSVEKKGAEIDKLVADAAVVGEEYRRVHARLKELDRAMRDLAERFKRDGQSSTKRQAEAAIKARNDYYDNTYKPVRDRRATAEKAITTARSDLKKIERDIEREKVKLQELLKADEAEQAKLNRVLDTVRRAEEPTERERLRALDNAVRALRKAQDEIKRIDDDLRKAEAASKAKADEAEARRRDADRWASAGQACRSGMAEAVVAVVDKLKALEGKENMTAGEANAIVNAASEVFHAGSSYDTHGWLPYMAEASPQVRQRLDARNSAAAKADDLCTTVSFSAYELQRLLIK